MTNPKGFLYDGETIFFIEEKGKDIGFPRWRACLYYEPNFAKTVFFESESAYNDFINAHSNDTYEDYSMWRSSRIPSLCQWYHTRPG